MTFKLYQSVPGICELLANALKEAGIDHYLGIPPTSFDPIILAERFQSHPPDRQIWGFFVKELDIDRGIEIIKACSSRYPQGVAPLTHQGKNKTFFVFITEDLLGEIKNDQHTQHNQSWSRPRRN